MIEVCPAARFRVTNSGMVSVFAAFRRAIAFGVLITASGAAGWSQSVIDFSQSHIFGSGRPGGPDITVPNANTFSEGPSFDLGDKSSGDFLYTNGSTWNDLMVDKTFSADISGGVASTGSDGSVTIGGNITRTHDSLAGTREFVTYRFGTNGIGLDVVITSETIVTGQVVVTNGLIDSTATNRAGIDIYNNADWNQYREGAGVFETSLSSATLDFNTTLPAGTYRFDLWGNIWTDPSMSGGTVEFDITLNFSPIPEPSVAALLWLGLGLMVLNRTGIDRRRA